ncbi:hypothetical protein ACFJGW_10845 [Burkholderiaceae bacterium UC74_6]
MSNPTASQVIHERLAAESVVRRAIAELQAPSVSFNLVYCEPTDNPALFVDVDGPFGIGRLTWWSTGNLHAEAICATSGEDLLAQDVDAPSADQAVATLKEIASVLLRVAPT